MRGWSWTRSLAMSAALAACSGGDPATDGPRPSEPVPLPEAPTGKLPTLLLAQAWFLAGPDGRPKPQPAKLVLWRTDGSHWWSEEILDPESNVFHKAIPFQDGILTIGAMAAKLKYWTRQSDRSWAAKTLWERDWPGKFDRLRDVEIGDVDGDGAVEIVIATHDHGVVAVGDEVDGTWTFQELDSQPDTFVHEIEIGDVDGDGKKEFYATPSDRNRSSGESQPGQVVRYDYRDGTYVRTVIADWNESHAKEITVADMDGDGTDELYAVREAHTEKVGNDVRIIDPVRILRLVPRPGAWEPVEVATLQDSQCRFLVPGDVDGDGTMEFVAAGYKSGLWRLEPEGNGFAPRLIESQSGGFEHATHVADLDGDGTPEIYVAADTQRSLKVYWWTGTGFDSKQIAPLADKHLSWNLQDGSF